MGSARATAQVDGVSNMQPVTHVKNIKIEKQGTEWKIIDVVIEIEPEERGRTK